MRSIILLLLILLPSVLAAQDGSLTKKDKRKLARQARSIYKSAVKYFERSEYDSAQTELDSVFKIDNSNPDAYYYSARINIIKGDTASSIGILEKGLIATPRSSRIKILLAKLKLASNDIPGALELAEAVLAFKPNEPEALYVKGQCLLNQGDSLTAIDILEHAAEIAIQKAGK